MTKEEFTALYQQRLMVGEIEQENRLRFQNLTLQYSQRFNRWGVHKYHGDDEVLVLEGVEFISKSAFASSKVREIYLPDAIRIEDSAFMNSNLTKIYAPKVQNIGAYAFANCPKLKRVNFPKVRQLKHGTFRGCISLRVANFDSLAAIKYDDTFEYTPRDCIIKGYCGVKISRHIPYRINTVTQQQDYTSENLRLLKEMMDWRLKSGQWTF